MKHRILVIIGLIFLAFASGAQDTVTIKKHLFPKLNYTMPVSYKQLSIDSPGLSVIFNPMAQTWSLDLSTYSPDATGVDHFKKPSNTEGGDQVTGADYGFEYQYGNAFFKNDGDDMQMVAFTPNLDLQFPLTFQFDSAVIFLQAPLQAGDTLVDSTTSLLQIPFFFDIRAKMTNKYVAIDNGSITFPNDTTMQVLRLKRELIFYAIAKDLINSTVDTLADTLVTWEFYAQGFRSTVLRGEFQLTPIDSVNYDTTLFLTYYHKKPVSIPKTGTLTQVEIQQFGNLLMVKSEVATNVRIVNLNGAELKPFGNKTHNHKVNLNALPKGAFIVQVQSDDGYTSQVLVK